MSYDVMTGVYTDNEKSCYAKLLSANDIHIQHIIDIERLELQQMLDEEDKEVGALHKIY